MYVYFIKAGNKKKSPIKIGVARDIARRLATLQTGNHQELLLVACIKCNSSAQAYGLESMFHRMFKRHRLRNEWFSWDINMSAVSKIRELYTLLP